jgi:hypothetical protein
VSIPQAAQSEVGGVAALSPSDAWAVGTGPGSGPVGATLVLHWNGTGWTRVPSPSPDPSNGSSLTSVSATSATDAWAVGIAGKGPFGTPESVNLALHWNGTTWAKVSVPSPNQQSSLNSVSADSPSDAWAVGEYFVGTSKTLGQILHWNGSTWTRVPSPNPGNTFVRLFSVSAVSSNDAWAVGTYLINRQQKTLILHWNGSTWTRVPSPAGGEVLTGVSALSSSDVWAVGAGPAGTFVVHWDGTSWAQVASPSPGGSISSLNGVSAISSSDAWAVGAEIREGNPGSTHTVVLHWNGTSWLRF